MLAHELNSLLFTCSFSLFDFQNHGNKKYASPSNAKRDKSSQGKIEKSFLRYVFPEADLFSNMSFPRTGYQYVFPEAMTCYLICPFQELVIMWDNIRLPSTQGYFYSTSLIHFTVKTTFRVWSRGSVGCNEVIHWTTTYGMQVTYTKLIYI